MLIRRFLIFDPFWVSLFHILFNPALRTGLLIFDPLWVLYFVHFLQSTVWPLYKDPERV